LKRRAKPCIGLHDISISRSSARSGGWGITVPGDDSQTIYVWIDALINYLTGLGAPESWQHWWNTSTRKIHLLGKNVWKFHAVYWPALLLSAGLPLPDELFVHGFLTVNGQKIGKSLGNAVDPFSLIETYGPEAVRYYLLRHVPAWADGDFADTEKEMLEALLEAYSADDSQKEELRAYAKEKRTLEDINLQDLSAGDRRVLLQHAVLLTFADGHQAAAESKFLDDLAVKLKVPTEEAKSVISDAETRAKKIEQFVGMLERHEVIHS
jgi:lysyl-tRNA synthetase class I